MLSERVDFRSRGAFVRMISIRIEFLVVVEHEDGGLFMVGCILFLLLRTFPFSSSKEDFVVNNSARACSICERIFVSDGFLFQAND